MKDLWVLLFFIEHDLLSCEWMVNVRPDAGPKQHHVLSLM